MPAAAVIPAPIAYTKFVAVKKLVVGSQVQAGGPARAGYCSCGLLPRPLACLASGPVRSRQPSAPWGARHSLAVRPRGRVWFRLRPALRRRGPSPRSPGVVPCSPALPLPAPLPAVLFAERPGRAASLL